MGAAITPILFQPPPPQYLEEPPRYSIPLNRDEERKEEEEGESSLELACFFIDNKSDTTILFSHGNAEDLGCFHTFYRRWSEEYGVNFFAYDYPGDVFFCF